jgi:hypothetical protein
MIFKRSKEKILRIEAVRIMSKKLFPYWLKQHIKYLENRKELIRVLEKDGRRERKQVQFPRSIAILFVGTGIYFNYFEKFYKNMKNNFLPEIPKKFFVFTDKDFKEREDVERVKIPDEKIYAILQYIKDIPTIKNLKNFEYVMKIDADIVVLEPLKSIDFFYHDKPLFGVRHPNFLSKQGSFETNPKSRAAVTPGEDLSEYIQCCFWGGKRDFVLRMVKEMYKNIDADLKNSIISKIFDESYLNKYFINHKSLFHIYPPTYSYPDRALPKTFKKMMIHTRNKKLKVDYQKRTN